MFLTTLINYAHKKCCNLRPLYELSYLFNIFHIVSREIWGCFVLESIVLMGVVKLNGLFIVIYSNLAT